MNIELGNVYQGTVQRILERGVIIKFDDSEETGFIHISQIADTFVSDIHDFVTEGMKVSATAVEGKVKPIELSLLNMNLKSSRHKDSYNNSKYRNNESRDFNKHKSNETNNLDNMISKSNEQYEDKMKSYNRNRYDRRKNHKNYN